MAGAQAADLAKINPGFEAVGWMSFNAQAGEEH
jgi:hypothetical protein